MEKATSLSAEDKSSLAQITEAKKASAKEAEMALLKNENVDLKYKLFVAQIFMRYGLSSEDQILDDGTFEFKGVTKAQEETA